MKFLLRASVFIAHYYYCAIPIKCKNLEESEASNEE